MLVERRDGEEAGETGDLTPDRGIGDREEGADGGRPRAR